MKLKTAFQNLPQSAFIFISLLSIIGAAVYRLYSLNNIGIIISLILTVIAFIIIQRLGPRNKKQETENKLLFAASQLKITNFLLFTFYFLLLISCLYILFVNRTADAVISPWQVIPWYFFLIYALAALILIVVIINNSKSLLLTSCFLLPIHYFLSFSVALIIYKIGFGFDPFIHQATVDLIDKTGAVEPKPFYYLGQYALEVILHKITALPLVWLDKFLVPLLAAIFLPITLLKVLKKWNADEQSSPAASLLLLALPFSFFTVTTPQNFSYLLLILTILLGLICKNIYDLVIIYILAFAALAFHPLAGIPALIFALLLTIHNSNKLKLKKYFYSLISILSIIALPLTFYFLEKSAQINSTPSWKFDVKNLYNIFSSLKAVIPGKENFILNFVYLYGFNLKFIIGIIAVAGIIIAYRRKDEFKTLSIYLLISTSLFISYMLAKNLPYSFLIDYERNNYSDRILLMASFFLLPFILIALDAFISAVLKQNKNIIIPLLIFVIILITTSLYNSYPRFDRYFNSHGFSTSQNDIEAVRWIEQNACRDAMPCVSPESCDSDETQCKDYIVLANQQVSAAALREFRFKKYYKIINKLEIRNYDLEIFYYPIPTGGPLYQYYLDMVYKKPSRETMRAAMDLVGVNEAYFVLNKYWWAFPKVLDEAKLEADSWQEFGKGEVYVFEYKK